VNHPQLFQIKARKGNCQWKIVFLRFLWSVLTSFSAVCGHIMQSITFKIICSLLLKPIHSRHQPIRDFLSELYFCRNLTLIHTGFTHDLKIMTHFKHFVNLLKILQLNQASSSCLSQNELYLPVLFGSYTLLPKYAKNIGTD
jgi:hypothetical protein